MPRQRVSPCLFLRFCLTLFDRFCLKENSSLSSQFLCMTVGFRSESAFALGLKNLTSRVPGLSDALGLSDIENLSTVLISILPHHVFKLFEKMLSNRSPRTCHELSTSVRWLSYVVKQRVSPCLSILTHIRLMLDLISNLQHPALMMSEV